MLNPERIGKKLSCADIMCIDQTGKNILWRCRSKNKTILKIVPNIIPVNFILTNLFRLRNTPCLKKLLSYLLSILICFLKILTIFQIMSTENNKNSYYYREPILLTNPDGQYHYEKTTKLCYTKIIANNAAIPNKQ